MHLTATSSGTLRRWAGVTLSAAIASSTLLATGVLATPAAQADTVTYPWSKITGTGNYIDDSYHVGADNVFENVTTDRLLDVLASDGDYYIFFGGPEHAASQALLPVVNDAAKASAGVKKIYHFDPYLDGYQLDSTLANGGADVTGGTSTNFKTLDGKAQPAKISDVWKLITNLLPASTTASDGALENYAGNTALLLDVNTTDRKHVDTGKTVTKLAEVKDADAAAFASDTGDVKTTTRAALGTAFTGKTADERTELEFFSRLYNASASYIETSAAASVNRIGSAVTIFNPADYPNPGDFKLKSIDLKELYNLLNSPGEVPILFAGQGCHNTQAIIGSVAKRAKELNIPVVYVVDFALDSNVKFGTGDTIDTASAASATGGLWVRASGTPSTATPYQYGYSYLYGKLAEYLGPNWVTENSSKKTSSVSYFPNAVLGETPTVARYSSGADSTTFNPATDKANATRLQVPTLVRYNKDAADPVVGTWLHKDKVAAGAAQTYTEYMLELAWVRQTDLAKASTGGYADGLTRVEFAAEAVASLDNVLKPNTTVQHTLTTTPTPTIGGSVVVGSTLEGYWDTFSQSPTLSFQWLADGTPIPGATSDSYVLTAAEQGKKISFQITASRPTYASATTVSAATAPVAGAAFATAPAPKITGTAKVGKVLTAVSGTWSPQATFAYQWNRNGKAIAKATGLTYKVTAADVDARLTVTATGRATGLADTSLTSAATGVVQGSKFTKTATPKISGTAKVGKTLKAKPGSWKPKSGVKFTYQWFANGTAISNATKSSLKLTAAQKGKKVTVKVTGKKVGYNAVTKAAKATKKVK